MSLRLDPVIITESFSQTDGNQAIDVSSFSRVFQVTAIPSVGATGTLKFSMQTWDDGVNTSSYETIIDTSTSAQQEINLASAKSFKVTGMIKRLRVEPTTVVGTYKLVIQQVEAL